ANIGLEVPCDIRTLGPHHDGDHQGQLIDIVAGDDYDRSCSCLLSTLNGVQVDHVDIAAAKRHQWFSNPSNSVTRNSSSIARSSRWISRSAAISANSLFEGASLRSWSRSRRATRSINQICSSDDSNAIWRSSSFKFIKSMPHSRVTNSSRLSSVRASATH